MVDRLFKNRNKSFGFLCTKLHFLQRHAKNNTLQTVQFAEIKFWRLQNAYLVNIAKMIHTKSHI